MLYSGKVTRAMIDYFAGDARHINHFLKVYGYARAIGEKEGLDQKTMEVLEIAALTHDIGIKNSELKYNSAAGNYQQIEGPPVAESMLKQLDISQPVIERVCWLIAHHHTYCNIIGIDYQILVEADFLVNMFDEKLPAEAIKKVRDKIFKTATGTEFLNCIYNIG
jgi:hypothetical protein